MKVGSHNLSEWIDCVDPKKWIQSYMTCYCNDCYKHHGLMKYASFINIEYKNFGGNELRISLSDNKIRNLFPYFSECVFYSIDDAKFYAYQNLQKINKLIVLL